MNRGGFAPFFTGKMGGYHNQRFSMKLFSALLLSSALLVPSAALAGGNNNGNGCRNRCGDTQVTNNNDYSGNNRNNTYNGGQGGKGGTGGQGGRGGQGGSVSGSGNSENTNRNRNDNTNRNNNGSNQSVVFEGDQREVPIAPLLERDSVGAIGDIAVPLPVISATGFASSRPDNTTDYGVSFGVRVPLGTGSFREAANEERQRRADRGQFRLIQEAVWLRDKGLLNEEAHPRHYAALYGNK